MNVKRNFVTAVSAAVIGVSLIGGGTYAYFNDTEETNNTFAAGLLDLGINKETVIHIEDLVPGDTINGNFQLTNDGTVDMKQINLISSYEVSDKNEPNNGDDLGDHIRVEYLHQVNGNETVVFQQLLSELNNKPTKILDKFPVGSDAEKFTVRFKFIDNKENQNHFQGDYLKLKWEFEAIQRDGKTNFQ